MPTSPQASPEDLEAEARLYVEWMRGAASRWLPGEPRPAARAAPIDVAAAVAPAAPARLPPGPPDPARWERLQQEVAACTRCRLCSTRTQTVFGSGSLTPRLVVVGEAPGAEEDRQGVPFVGASGEMLTRMLAGIGLSRERDVYILNVLKCRPPGNRPPAGDEVAACTPYLREQLERLGPPLVLSLGAPAAQALLQTGRGIGSLRGRFATTPEGWRVMPTFHPSYLLRTPEAKREVWQDLKRVAEALGLAVPAKGTAPTA